MPVPACIYSNFYPRSPCGERPSSVRVSLSGSTFLSTLSLRRATQSKCLVHGLHLFLSTLSLRRATISGATGLIFRAFLSTLSLRRATTLAACIVPSSLNFYPRSPCGERPNLLRMRCWPMIFLSTLSLRRATTSL